MYIYMYHIIHYYYYTLMTKQIAVDYSISHRKKRKDSIFPIQTRRRVFGMFCINNKMLSLSSEYKSKIRLYCSIKDHMRLIIRKRTLRYEKWKKIAVVDDYVCVCVVSSFHCHKNTDFSNHASHGIHLLMSWTCVLCVLSWVVGGGALWV